MAFVNDPTNKATWTFIDASGKKATLQLWAETPAVDPAGAPYAAVSTALNGASDAQLTQCEVSSGASDDDPAVATVGIFDHVEDKMELFLKGVDGSPVRLKFPAPKDTAFFSGSVRVDPSGAVLALIQGLKDNCVTAEGTEIKFYTGGRRMSPPRIGH